MTRRFSSFIRAHTSSPLRTKTYDAFTLFGSCAPPSALTALSTSVSSPMFRLMRGCRGRAPMPDADDTDLMMIFGAQQAELGVYGHIHRPYVRTLVGLTVADTGSDRLPHAR